jgi:hypothetical protein
MKTFPILGSTKTKEIPWSLIEPHREQALRNHAQTLEQLASRGGLDPRETMAVLLDQNLRYARDLGLELADNALAFALLVRAHEAKP